MNGFNLNLNSLNNLKTQTTESSNVQLPTFTLPTTTIKQTTPPATPTAYMTTIENTESTSVPDPKDPTKPADAPVQKPVGVIELIDLDVNDLVTMPPIEKKVPKADPTSLDQVYHIFPVQCRYASSSGSHKSLLDCMVEFPEMTSETGINHSVSNGRDQDSIMGVFKVMENEEHRKAVDKLKEIHQALATLIEPHRGVFKTPHFSAKIAEATGFTQLVYYFIDKANSAPIQGRDPVFFFKLFEYGFGSGAIRSSFIGLNGKEIPWALLRNARVTFKPLVHIKQIYATSGKIRCHCFLNSCIVTSFKERSTSELQRYALSKMVQNNPDLADAAASQIAAMSARRAEDLLQDKKRSEEREAKLKARAKQGGTANPTNDAIPNLPPVGTNLRQLN